MGPRRRLVIPILFLLAMLFGNHQGKLEDIWLIGIAAFLVLLLVMGRPPAEERLAQQLIRRPRRRSPRRSRR